MGVQMLVVRWWWWWLVVVVVAGVCGDEGGCRTSRPSLKLTGNVTITAILDGHAGSNCTTAVDKGRQQMATLAWVVNTLNHAQFLPGAKIGLSLFDGCSTFDSAERALLASAMGASCEDRYSVGLLTTPAIHSPLKPLADAVNIPVSLTVDLMSTRYQSAVAVSMLTSAGWWTVTLVLATSSDLLDTFNQAAREEGLCVRQARVLEGDSDDHVEVLEDGLVVVLGGVDTVNRLVQAGAGNNSVWLVLPSDMEESAEELPARSVVVLPNPVVLRPPLAEDAAHSDPWASVSRHVFLDVASSVFDVVRRLKAGAEVHCPANTSLCAELPPFERLLHSNYTPSKDATTIQRLFRTLHINTHNENSIFYNVYRVEQFENGTKHLTKIGFYQILDFDESQNAVFNYTDIDTNNGSAGLNLTERCLPYTYVSDENECHKCVNLRQVHGKTMGFSEKFLFATVTLREESWVAALFSISVLGVLCCLAIATFIIVRSCKGDVLEGNPSFSFLLLFALILTYASILPFSVHLLDSGLLCGLRIFATCTSYALLFSIMLARSLMLASCDNEGGFMSHVNGYLQSVLCFFMCGVQVALSVQFWIISTHFLPKDQCSFYKGFSFLVILSYDAFLLVILLCSTPFIAQSKRNYREGVFFTAAAILCTLVWSAWVVGYVFAPRWRDFFVAAGLTATASSILVTVFIPRTYLMISALTRDNIANALPAMMYNSSSILDLNYRNSSQALYATVNPPGDTLQSSGVANPNFYSEQPDFHNLESNTMTVPSTAKLNSCAFGSRRNGTPENTYERYDTPPSPLKVTRF